MKKIMCMLAVLLAAALFSFSGCSPQEETKIDKNLFDDDILEAYNIPWLQKPDEAINERQYFDGHYTYEANFQEYDDYTEYYTSVFTQFQEKGYSLFRETGYDSHGELWSHYTCGFLESIENPNEALLEHSYMVNYNVYYTPSPLGDYDTEHDGYTADNIKYLIFMCSKERNENGLFTFYLYLAAGREHYYVQTADEPSASVAV